MTMVTNPMHPFSTAQHSFPRQLFAVNRISDFFHHDIPTLHIFIYWYCLIVAMGNSLHHGISGSLPYRIRYNDSSLTELGLTTSLDEDELKSVIQALPRNHTIRVVVMFDSFTSHVLQEPLQWNDFVQALASVSSLQQVELLETCVPLDSLRYLLEKPTLQTLAVTDGVELGSVTYATIVELGAALTTRNHPNGPLALSSLQEFVWECQFPTVENLLDPLLEAFTSSSHLKLLGLVNSSTNIPTISVALLSPERLLEFSTRQRSTLQTLDLSGCGLNDHHVQGICQGLQNGRKPCTMERLHLQRNEAVTKLHGWNTMLDFVKSNHHYLKSLLLTDMDTVFQEQVQLWMAWNRHVRQVLGEEPTPLALLFMIWRVKEQADFLFLLLREYPEIYMKNR